ncbi:NAD(P)-dependent oxidoreductase [Actinosynnema sp. NPDC047251]|uniref:3-hydroxyisobutyrate dehydrogenase-like protein n=1 Tax=Saccharothrix espanaensis (strain ATCC 51144 / DSM 44229 / JCM 9112 / NBRC 15066 / NRRL 15764) TaxID=1179773 RepID=K0JSV8_SACES|nr:NAD(P)-dependent oxidoreductase [Saccharothrix espanaensis]CCH30835.1 3-hydroxyisobutyrate dehydrogenase-like protein [Saccharothrix espanaensis DSM 44229]
MTAIALLGQGRMGVPMAVRLVAAGHPTTVWNRTPDKCATAGERGARVADSPADAVRDADVVITMLRDADAVDAVLSDDTVAALRPDVVLLEMSTIGPDAVRALRERLRADVVLLDAPVVGSIPQATAGELRILVGGAESDVERCADVLAVLGSADRVGDLGAGAAAKLVANLVTISAFAVIGESLALGDRLGLTDDRVLDLLAKSAIGGFSERVRGRLGTTPPAQFGLGLAEKDLALVLAAGADPAGVAGAAHQNFADAVAAGLAGHDISAVVADMRSRAHAMGN